MQAALIIMTILGCDDTATQCHYIERVDATYATIQACDAQSETQLQRYSARSYPVIVAVCQTPEVAEATVPETDDGTQAATLPTETATGDIPATSMTGRVLAEAQAQVRRILPEAGTVRSIVAKPVHVVTDTYSWVARRF